MKKIFLILMVILITAGVTSLGFSGQPDEDKYIENLYDSGAMTGYATAPTTQPFWYGSGSPAYYPYYWLNYRPQITSGYNIEVKPAGKIIIQVEPLDAAVYVDANKLQQFPDLTYQVVLFAGDHQVDIIKEGYDKFSEKITIYPGSGIIIPVKLNKKIETRIKNE